MAAIVEGKLSVAWIKARDQVDNLMSKIRAYYLPGTKIKPDIKCNASKCQLPVKSAEYLNPVSTRYEYNPMIFCFTCDSTHHVKCVGLTKDTIAEEAVPWLCPTCQKDVTNPTAAAYYKSTNYMKLIKERRKRFLRESTIADDTCEFDTDDEYDSCDIEAFARDSKGTASVIQGVDTQDSIRLQQEVIVAKGETKRAVAKAAELEKLLERERLETAAKFKNLCEEMEKLRVEMHSSKSREKLSVNHGHSETFNMSSFYASNVQSPEGESTRWKSVTINNPQKDSRPNTSTADTSTLEVLTRFTDVQEKIQTEKELSTIRKAMPKIAEFHGDAMKWLEFEQDVSRYRNVCKYDDATIKLHVRGALKGDAFETVKDVFDIFALAEIMNVLREAFGDPMTLVRRKSKDIRILKVPEKIYREDAVNIRVVLQGYFAACTYAETGYINSNELAETIYEQFNYEDKARCKEMFVRKNPGKQIVVSLTTIYDYLAERLPLLDEKPEHLRDKNGKKEDKKSKPLQVMSIGASLSNKNDKNGYKFEVRDRATAPYMGYNMDVLNSVSKKCEFCGRSGHYSVQCNQYKDMAETQRLKVINDKRLCRNCVVATGHKASECRLKISCGMKLGKNGRCTQKHHASIHYACDKPSNGGYSKRRSHTRQNTSNAQQVITNAMQNNITSMPQASENLTSQQQTAGAIQRASAQTRNVNAHSSVNSSTSGATRDYIVNSQFAGAVQVFHVADNVPRTVKMFKNKLFGPNGYVNAYSVGDSAAELTLVRNDLRVALGIQGTPDTIAVQWTDGSIKYCEAVRFDMEVQGILSYSEKIVLKDCYAIDDLDLPIRTLDMQKMKTLFPYLKDVQFEGYFEEQPVMLIGSPHAYAIESIKGLIEGGPGNPVALEAKLGVTVYGGNPDAPIHTSASINTVTRASGQNYRSILDVTENERVTNEELSDLITYFNSVETLGIRAGDSHRTESEKKAIEIMQEELKVLENGSIEVPLVWDRQNREIPKLPNNYPLAYKRQLAHEAKLAKNPVHLAAYNKNVKDLIDLGYMRYATDEDLNGNWPNIWYLPMSLVINENKVPPKYRNVYDASAKYEGVSLNDKLLKGPDLLIDILKPLLRMRMNDVAFTADVQHMFHRMKICPRDQQCQRVLWRESPDQPMKTLILDSMAFGPSPSPFTSQFVKIWNANNWSDKHPEAAATIKDLMYMDDVIASEPTVDKAVKIATECIAICKHINWNLVSFQSNSKEFLRKLPGDHIKKELFPILTNEAEEFTTKVLGCHWNTIDDCLVFELAQNIFVKLVTEFKHHPTKRDQSSTIARIYDVLGLIAHFLIRGKILLQRSWKAKVKWDDPIPEELQHEWCKWLEEIENISKLRISRKYCSLNSIKDADKLQLHVFCDAGVEAFGAVAYWAIHHHEIIETSLIMAKAKVTPLKFQTKTEIKGIPRLELLAATLAVRIGDKISKSFPDLEFERHFWSDSEVVLRWILNPEAKLLNYAIGPIEEILELTKRSEWRYVSTLDNPADLCTKFKSFDFADSSSIWFVGPQFIKSSFESWPQMPEKLMVDEIVMANNIYLQQLKYSTHKLPPLNCPLLNDNFIDNFSPSITAKWTKLRRAVARRIKLFSDIFIPLIKSKQYHNIKLRLELKGIHEGFQYITAADLERAEHFIFRKMQRESYPAEYAQLLKGQQIKNKEFQQLNVFMDQQKIIRINARTNLNRESHPQQYVPLLPRKNALIRVLLMFYHEKYRHIAVESQVAEIRMKCWIPQVRQELKRVKAHCNECQLRSAMPYDPIMGPLPDYRIDPDLQPFEVTGVDLFGPINTICNGRTKKVWVMLFTCAMSRFIHLQIMDSLESLKVLEAIVVFWCAHGPVRQFVSDNGTNFVGAAKILKEDYVNTKIFLSKQPAALGQKLSDMYNVEWKFIPPSSPWFGGFYERLIREVKRSIADTLTQKKINRVELNIALNEAAHRINLRPLTKNPIGAEDEIVLTPHHLAKHRSGWPLLPGLHNGMYQEVDDRSIYRKGRIIADEIMRKFVSYYLPVLTRRVKWLMDKEPLKENDLVLMVEPNMTRKEWPRGKIVKLFYGKDGQPRVADVLKANGKIKRRPIRKLAKINIQLPPKNL